MFKDRTPDNEANLSDCVSSLKSDIKMSTYDISCDRPDDEILQKPKKTIKRRVSHDCQFPIRHVCA